MADPVRPLQPPEIDVKRVRDAASDLLGVCSEAGYQEAVAVLVDAIPALADAYEDAPDLRATVNYFAAQSKRRGAERDALRKENERLREQCVTALKASGKRLLERDALAEAVRAYISASDGGRLSTSESIRTTAALQHLAALAAVPSPDVTPNPKESE